MAADFTEAFSIVSLSDDNMSSFVGDVQPFALALSMQAINDWNAGSNPSEGGGDTRPTSGFLYPRGQS